MRIIFLTQTSQLGPSSRHRVYQYLDFLKREGIHCKVSPAISGTDYAKVYNTHRPVNKLPYFGLVVLKRLIDLTMVGGSDIVFLQKEVLPQTYPLIEKFIKKLNRKLVFDFDDAIFLLPPKKRSLLYNFRYKNSIPRILRISDYVIAGNEYLKQYALKFNGNVEVIPTSIDTEIYCIKEKNKNDKINIGWIGSQSTLFYLDQLRNVFTALAKRYNICLTVIGTGDYRVDGVETVTRPWRLEREISDLQCFDIGVAPLNNDDWALGKCGCKVIQYMGVGIPAVASLVGIHGKIINDGVNGFLADSDEEWIEKLSQLIENEALRQKFGSLGRKTVEERYSVKVNAPKLLEILQKVNRM
jgi:glycosyltransferase involved in cell wall biosynthesis